jgi:alpha,alpha-trehalase
MRIHSGHPDRLYISHAGGIAATSSSSLKQFADLAHPRQWDYPNGWAPHQILIWKGLSQSGYNTDAERLTYKWLFMITQNAMDYQGTIPEKYDVVKRSHDVFAEYGNVGTDFSYITKEGFGWINASYEIGVHSLPASTLQKLKEVIPPEWP